MQEAPSRETRTIDIARNIIYVYRVLFNIHSIESKIKLMAAFKYQVFHNFDYYVSYIDTL